MKINEILVESTQLDEAGLIKTAAKGVGKAVGGIAKGIGAVAGGISAIPGAVKKGFQAGRAAVQGNDDGEPSADQVRTNLATTGNPVGAPSAKTTPAGSTGSRAPQAAPTTSAPAAAKSQQPKPAVSKAPVSTPQQSKSAEPAATTPAAQSAYAQIKSNVDKLDKKGKQRILQSLEKELGPVPTKSKSGATQSTNKPGALGSLVQQQLATAKTKTATGGTVTNPKPGVTQHTASPNNPNAAFK